MKILKNIIRWLYIKFVNRLYIPKDTQRCIWIKGKNGQMSVLSQIDSDYIGGGKIDIDYIKLWKINDGSFDEFIL